MKFIAKLLGTFGANALGIYVASIFITGFYGPETLLGITVAAVVLTLINFFIKPALKLLFGPIILLTFGIALILVNMFTLVLLDYLLETVRIVGISPLLIGTILISAVNLILKPK